MLIIDQKQRNLLSLAWWLATITIIYNLIEGGISTYFGSSDETLALFGFGFDSFVEVLSGTGIAHMIMRMKNHPVNSHDHFEIVALRITGWSFYFLTAGLLVGASLAVLYQATPETTIAGIVISSISILTMYFLYIRKLKIGHMLKSDPIISDAKCTRTCFYLSFILLASSLIYELFKIPYIDAAGSLGIAWYAYREGKEALQKAKTKNLGCSDSCC